MKPPRQIFEFDAAKAASNLKKHGVSFAEAMTVFDDALSSTLPDDQTLERRTPLHHGWNVFAATSAFCRLH
ncbi:BrnT family toxin [Granulicella mallensis]|uniref:Uncharacterized DUF497 family protein n=1 Tax=Granulicella mallensis TaxID=940614 RepID=A0A7W8EAR5_9BACT|nr:BrnT family toxin [Granulicella mallensis]MBB5064996.1 uncharacterized DUF497 family protein [Granulicella mallensis]